MIYKTPIYIAGFCPLILLGIEYVLQQEEYQFISNVLPNEMPVFENSKSSFLMVIHLKKSFASNLKFIKKFSRLYPFAKMIVLCENCNQAHIKNFFKSGVRAYLLPTVNHDRLKQAINEVFTGKSFLDFSVSEKWINATLNSSKIEVKLTRREEEVLNLIIEEHTTKEIAKKLYISSCTAETHRINIIRKMGVRNTAGIVREAMRMGR